MMDDQSTIEVVLVTPTKIDNQIVMPDGKPIRVTADIHDELVAAGAVASGDVDVVFASEPSDFEKSVADEAEKVAALIVQEAIASALSEQEKLLETVRAENVTALRLVAQAEARADAAEETVAALKAELAQALANTEAAKTTSKKGAAAKG